MDRQEEFVLRTLEERDIRFVRLWFTDVLGALKSVAVAPAELEGAFADGIGFDGSAIEGFARVHESGTAGVAQEMWALFAVYQALCKITGIGDPAVTNVARYIQFHLLEPWMIT